MSNLTCPNGYILLPLTHESHMPLHGCILSVLCKFSKKTLLIMHSEVPVSQSVEIFYLLIIIIIMLEQPF